MKNFAILLFAACAAFGAGILRAEIRLPELFSDGAVFQRQEPVKVWGTAEPGAAVEVEFAGRASPRRRGRTAGGRCFSTLWRLPPSRAR